MSSEFLVGIFHAALGLQNNRLFPGHFKELKTILGQICLIGLYCYVACFIESSLPFSKSNATMLDVEVLVGHGFRWVYSKTWFISEFLVLPAKLLPEFFSSRSDLRLDFGDVFC